MPRAAAEVSVWWSSAEPRRPGAPEHPCVTRVAISSPTQVWSAPIAWSRPEAARKKRSFRVKLSKAARRALARRRSTNVSVRGKFTEPTGSATIRDSDTIRVVR